MISRVCGPGGCEGCSTIGDVSDVRPPPRCCCVQCQFKDVGIPRAECPLKNFQAGYRFPCPYFTRLKKKKPPKVEKPPKAVKEKKPPEEKKAKKEDPPAEKKRRKSSLGQKVVEKENEDRGRECCCCCCRSCQRWKSIPVEMKEIAESENRENDRLLTQHFQHLLDTPCSSLVKIERSPRTSVVRGERKGGCFCCNRGRCEHSRHRKNRASSLRRSIPEEPAGGCRCRACVWNPRKHLGKRQNWVNDLEQQNGLDVHSTFSLRGARPKSVTEVRHLTTQESDSSSPPTRTSRVQYTNKSEDEHFEILPLEKTPVSGSSKAQSHSKTLTATESSKTTPRKKSPPLGETSPTDGRTAAPSQKSPGSRPTKDSTAVRDHQRAAPHSARTSGAIDAVKVDPRRGYREDQIHRPFVIHDGEREKPGPKSRRSSTLGTETASSLKGVGRGTYRVSLDMATESFHETRSSSMPPGSEKVVTGTRMVESSRGPISKKSNPQSAARRHSRNRGASSNSLSRRCSVQNQDVRDLALRLSRLIVDYCDSKQHRRQSSVRSRLPSVNVAKRRDFASLNPADDSPFWNSRFGNKPKGSPK